MSDEARRADWGTDRYALSSDADIVPRLAELVGVPLPPNSTWRAAIVTLFETNPEGIAGIYLQHIQDLNWPVPEEALLKHVIVLLQHRVDHTDLKATSGRRAVEASSRRGSASPQNRPT